MGQKVHPTGIRLGITKEYASIWYAESSDYAGKLFDDLKVRKYLEDRLKNAQLSKILIERPAQNAKVTLLTARPGIVIGKKGEDVEKLRKIEEILAELFFFKLLSFLNDLSYRCQIGLK